jgi:outer membrane protein assembly factor BamE (lipoprotein component of BamABCDE complex)
MKNLTFVLFLSFLLTGCAMQAPTAPAVSNDFTLGKVQSQLSNGMSSSEVVSLLGSPNLVTSTKDGGEAWTYDKISQESESSSISGAGAGSSGNFFGIFGGGRSKSSTSSKNLTLIVKLNVEGIVTDFKYQSIKY